MDNQSNLRATLRAALSKAGASVEVMLCVLPPPNQWQQYVTLKDPFFKASLRTKGREPFPHVTLIQARLEDAEETLETLINAIYMMEQGIHNNMVQAFPLNFQTMGSFKFKKGSVIYVTDANSEAQDHFARLHSVATSSLPPSGNNNNDNTFTPHIGLGSVPAKKFQQIQKEYSDVVSKWHESSFTCEHVYLLVRGPTGPWTVAAAIPLSGCEDTPPSVPIGSETTVKA